MVVKSDKMLKKNENFYKKFLKKHKKNFFYDFLGKSWVFSDFYEKNAFLAKKDEKRVKKGVFGVKKGRWGPPKRGILMSVGERF